MTINSDFLKFDFENAKSEATRVGFGKGLKAAGEIDPKVVALCADLTESTQMHHFKAAFPERFFEVGIAEQNLVTTASGLASVGFFPFTSSYAAFSPGRNWEQIRTTICLNNQPVCIVGSHAGLSVGPDGATHQALEDIALMRVLPRMYVFAPADSTEAEFITKEIARIKNQAYIRLAREGTPILFDDSKGMKIGKAIKLATGTDITLLSTGVMTPIALAAAIEASKKGLKVDLLHYGTIKPFDKLSLLKSVSRTRRVVTIEEGQKSAGFGSLVCEILAENDPVPVLRMGVDDRFGESGKPSELYQKHKLTVNGILKNINLLM